MEYKVYKLVPADYDKISPFYANRNINTQHVNRLRNLIKEGQPLLPVYACKVKDKSNKIHLVCLDGHHRISACMKENAPIYYFTTEKIYNKEHELRKLVISINSASKKWTCVDSAYSGMKAKKPGWTYMVLLAEQLLSGRTKEISLSSIEQIIDRKVRMDEDDVDISPTKFKESLKLIDDLIRPMCVNYKDSKILKGTREQALVGALMKIKDVDEDFPFDKLLKKTSDPDIRNIKRPADAVNDVVEFLYLCIDRDIAKMGNKFILEILKDKQKRQ